MLGHTTEHGVPYSQLIARKLDNAVACLEEWNEPDGYLVGKSTIVQVGSVITVTTPTVMNYIGQPDTLTTVVASYSADEEKRSQGNQFIWLAFIGDDGECKYDTRNG